MTDQCNNCRFWDRYGENYDAAARSKGDCRRSPPRISETILSARMPRDCDDIDDSFVSTTYLASAFPVTHGSSWCGEHQPIREEVIV